MRAARASLPSLIAISAAFFLPFVKGCDKMVSAVGIVTSEWPKLLPAVWIVPRFAVAALLLVLTLCALWRGRAPGAASATLAGVGLLSMLPASVIDAYDLACKAWRFDLFRIGLGGTVVLGAVGVYWALAACRRQGWERWERLVAAYAALAAPFVCFVIAALADGWREVGLGGYAYATGIIILLTLRGLSAHAAKCRTDVLHR